MIIPPVLAVALAIGFAPSAFAAEEFTVTSATSLDELKVALADVTTQTVTFTEDVNFDGGIVINHPMTFVVNDGIEVNFETAVGHALDIKSEFTLNNLGDINLASSGGYGIKINQKVPGQSVVFMGDVSGDSSINVGPTKNYGVDGQLLNGPFTVKNTTLNIAPGPDTLEGPMIFSKNAGESVNATVLFDNATLNLDHSSKDAAERAALNSEREMMFRNSEIYSTTVRNYNLSFVAGSEITFDNSITELVTAPDAVTNGFLFLKKPFVSINTGDSTINILESEISSDIQATSGPHEALQFQDATYNVVNSIVIADSLGVDYKQKTGSFLNISGDSKVEIPGTAAMPNNKITTVIDGGTVVLPQNATAKNTQGQDLYEFISDGASEEVLINCTDKAYTYPVSKISNDVLKHVWAPAVNVDYYVNETDDMPADTRKLIAGTNVDEELNSVDFFTIPEVPTGFSGKFVIFDPAPESDFTSASKVCKNTKVTFRINQTPLVPIPDVETTDLDVFVGDTVEPTDGLVDLPEGATVTIVTPADTTKAGETTQTVKITFKDGSSVTKTIKVTVAEHLTPLVPAQPITPTEPTEPTEKPTKPTVQPTMPEKPGLAKTGISTGTAGWLAALLMISGAGIAFTVKRRKNA
ncbi:hypothetical protein JTE88_07910 [Arcanobacterium phocisimile]|uniref:Gram-positive cocci surface proteins LPxTG domain-containing protein n=1 Tax=Arcanobacterium phocisimile TaxID=1302235 RepID=A0ABX7IGN2_9ACTO|nr:Rib/alpha-like domain-containing protein [Arcanobacterium phocisimile]QRV01992.1 hypothetical protein JTE88_07910 [Arcanobacterium phocisimile]